MKEMVGGCCVCSDERGWPENPLVYCDGQNCTVAVHQACYGIVTVPTGPWYCRKCESQERSARVRCELCPSRDGALKKTDNQGWAHVVCALYIPEVRFGNVTTMEPIILQLIPPERYAKTCYICQQIGKPSRATVGACMQCNKSGCKQQFHVTCAQGLGLLCEEAGNYLDNVKYCGYCQHHYSKLKKGGNVKTIPPYKPITHETGSSDSTSSPEKELEPLPSTSSNSSTTIKINSSQQSANSSPTSSSSKQRKSSSTSKISGSSSSSSSTSNLGVSGGGGGSGGNSGSNVNTSSSNSGSSKISTSNNSSSSKDKEKHSKSLGKISSSSKSQQQQERGDSSSSSSSSTQREKSSKSSKNKDSSLSSNLDHMQNSSITTGMQSLSSTGTNNTTSLSTNSGTNLSSNSSISISAKESLGTKFTTSNFTENVVSSESVFGSNSANNELLNNTISTTTTTTTSSSSSINKSSSNSSSTNKKRKSESMKLSNSNAIVGNSGGSGGSGIGTDSADNKDLIKDVSVTLVPLPIDKSDVGDSESIKTTKKPKTELTSPSSVVHHESSTNLQQVSSSSNIKGIHTLSSSGNTIFIKQQTSSSSSSAPSSSSSNSTNLQQQQITTNATNMSSHHHIKNLKEDSRLRSNSPYTSSSNMSTTSSNMISSGSGNHQGTTPSLYVSVPLSTANVPGVNLPSATSNVNEHITQSQSNRSSPLVNSHHTNLLMHHQQNNINSSSQSMIERQSSRINQQQQQQHHHHHHHHHHQSSLNDHNNISGSSTQSSSQVSSVIQPSSSNNNTPSIGHTAGNPINAVHGVSTMESGTLKITYEKQNLRVSQLQEQEQIPARRSRTPDTNNFSATLNTVTSNSISNNATTTTTNSSSLNNGGLKFTYESQIGATVQSISPSIDTLQSTTAVKDSPPSSPGSEAGSARKRSRKSSDAKDIKIFHNGGVHATHMLGNQLNPASSVAQKMSDQLNMEIEDHSVYTQPSIDSGPQLVGVPFPGKQNSTRSSSQSSNSITSMLGGGSSSNPMGNNPQSLEQLLERQWEQGSQFLMEQAQHFDIASLLSCLHQLRTENVRLEEHVNNLIARRDHLLAVNARLAIPLSANVSQNQAPINNIHMNGPTTENATSSSRISRANAHFNTQPQQPQQPQQQQQMPVENGIDYRHTSHQTTTSQTTIRHSSSHSNYSSSTSSTHTQHHSVLSSSSSSSSSSASNSGGRQQQHPISGTPGNSGPIAGATGNPHSSTEQLVRSARGSLSSNSNSSIAGGGGGGGNYHSATQQSYSNVHQSQMRRDDGQGKPS